MMTATMATMHTQLYANFYLCQRVEVGCMQYGDPQFSLNLSIQLRIFRGILRREELMTATQDFRISQYNTCTGR